MLFRSALRDRLDDRRLDFRSVRGSRVRVKHPSAASDQEQQVARASQRLNLESRFTLASRPFRAVVRSSKKDTLKANGSSIRFELAREQVPVRPLTSSRSRQYNVSRAQ